MQQRNFWLFLFLSLTILLGWTWLQIQFAPPKKPDEPKPQVKEEPPEPVEKPAPVTKREAARQGQIAARLLLAPAGPPVGLAPVLNFLGTAPAAEQMTQLAFEAIEKKPKKVLPPVEIKTFVLGDDNFYLQAILTTRGAGVQKLTLTKFQAASWEGLPVYLPDGRPAPLDLIPEDPIKPSFLMYHYPDPSPTDPDSARPDGTLGERVWELDSEKKEPDKHTVVFKTRGPPGYEHLLLKKTYTLRPRQYHIDLKLDIEDTGEPVEGKRKEFRYQLAGAHGLPIEGGWYTYTFRNTMIGMVDTRDVLWRTMQESAKISHLNGGDRVPTGARGQDAVKYAGTATQYFASMIAVSDQQPEGVDPRDILAYARPTLESREKPCFVDHWNENVATVRIADDQRQSLTMQVLPRAREDLTHLRPKPGEQIIVNYYSTHQDGKEIFVATGFREGTVVKPFLEDVTVRIISDKVSLSAGDQVGHQFVLYHGPVKVRQLAYVADRAGEVDPALIERYTDTLHLLTLTDYPTVTFFAWWSDLIIFFTRAIHWLLNFLYRLIPIEGITIILLTVLVRGLMFPISRKQAMTAMRMQELAPEMKKLQEKYKNDPQARNQAMMELYRKHQVNPLGGCLPLVLQLPIFLGLYFALQESIRFRLIPFLWIQNLSAPDMLFYWGRGFPWITDPDAQGGMLYLGPYFNLLPILAVITMLISTKLMMPPPQDEQQAMQQKMMKYMMIFIGIMFYKIAAGLSIYFLATTLWGIAERKLLPKKKPAVPAPPVETPPATGKLAPAKPKDPAKLNPAQRRKLKAKGGKKPEQPDTTLKKVKDWWEDVLKQAKKK